MQDLIIDCFTESKQKPAAAQTWDQSEERAIYIHNLLNLLSFTVYTLNWCVHRHNPLSIYIYNETTRKKMVKTWFKL